LVTTLTKAGRYDLREELGRGAMGVVYKGFDPTIGRNVAVKTLRLTEAGTGLTREELIGRFQTEARAAGLLTHPNIVVIYDAGEEDGLFYITMEFVEGRSLQSLIDAQQTFPVSRVLKLMEQVCSALDFAHQHNVVHRDIKPANLMLTSDDIIKITDFGTAKILQFGTAQTAHVMGTPSYMSPEQVKGKPVDGRSDIFSLGVILYELTTGEKPFPGQNITTVIYKIINEEPIPPRSLDSAIHPGLSTVITRALAKDPAARYQSCHELLTALKNYHDVTSPDATVRVTPQASAAAQKGIRPAAQPTRVPAVPVAAASQQPDASAPVMLSVPMEEEPSKRPGGLLLTLVLLGIIGYAGYRVYAPLKDLWERAHEAVHERHTPAASDSAPQASSPDGSTAQPEGQSAEDAPQVKTPSASSAAPPAATALQKPAAPPAISPARQFETRLRGELAGSPLAGKVQFQAAGNALMLSGTLSTAEHRQLLDHLHTLPMGVRIVDDIEYGDESKAPPTSDQ
jgi:eukaryotic-like serine/threonine-protein kinase